VKEKKVLLGGLNSDDSFSVLASEDYTNAENIRIVTGGDGKAGAIKETPSTVSVSYADLPGGSIPALATSTIRLITEFSISRIRVQVSIE